MKRSLLLVGLLCAAVVLAAAVFTSIHVLASPGEDGLVLDNAGARLNLGDGLTIQANAGVAQFDGGIYTPTLTNTNISTTGIAAFTVDAGTFYGAAGYFTAVDAGWISVTVLNALSVDAGLVSAREGRFLLADAGWISASVVNALSVDAGLVSSAEVRTAFIDAGIIAGALTEFDVLDAGVGYVAGMLQSATLKVGGGAVITKPLLGTVAVTGGSISAGACANQGAAITTTGAAAADACFLGLSASPGNGLAYSCVTSSNACQIVACNASAGSLTSLTGTHTCFVVH